MSHATGIQEYLGHEYRCIHVTMIIVSDITSVHYNKYLYDITVFSMRECPCNNDTSTWNNSVSVMVIQAHETTMSSVTWYMCNNDTSTWITVSSVIMIQIHEITVSSVIEYPCNSDIWNNSVNCNKYV